MIYGYPTSYWAAGAGAVVVIVASAVFAYYYVRERRRLVEAVTKLDETAGEGEEEGAGHSVRLEPPETSSSLTSLLSHWRTRAKQKRLAEKGYIKWHKIGARLERPKWVKPDVDGTGEPEYYDSEEEVTYLFPEEAMVTDAETGAWVAYHRRNEVEPINMRDPGYPAMDADRAEEVVNMMAESDPRSWWDQINITQSQMVMGAIAILFLGFAAMRYMG